MLITFELLKSEISVKLEAASTAHYTITEKKKLLTHIKTELHRLSLTNMFNGKKCTLKAETLVSLLTFFAAVAHTPCS